MVLEQWGPSWTFPEVPVWCAGAGVGAWLGANPLNDRKANVFTIGTDTVSWHASENILFIIIRDWFRVLVLVFYTISNFPCRKFKLFWRVMWSVNLWLFSELLFRQFLLKHPQVVCASSQRVRIFLRQWWEFSNPVKVFIITKLPILKTCCMATLIGKNH